MHAESQWQRRLGGAFLPPRFRPGSIRRRIRADRHQHHRARRHTFDGPTLDLRKRGEIYRANRRLKWPGLAAVVVSVLHVWKGRFDGVKQLDARTVDKITAFLFHRGGNTDPARLKVNAGKSFQGSIILGMGFTFDDTDRNDAATPLVEMDRLIEKNEHNEEIVFPYMGGEEVNATPTHAHDRYIINFRDWPLRRVDFGSTWRDAHAEARQAWLREGLVPRDYPEPVAADWPDLLAIVEEKVKPQRSALPPKNSINRDAAKLWWRFLAYRQGLHSAIAGLGRVLVVSRVSNTFAFTFLPERMVHNDKVIVFPFANFAPLAALQSRLTRLGRDSSVAP